MLVPIAAVLFAFGYVLQAGVINVFITRPEHSQFLLLVAVAIIIVNVLLIIFGPDAQSVQTSYSLRQLSDRRADHRCHQGLCRRRRWWSPPICSPFSGTPARHGDPRLRRQLYRRVVVGLDVKRLYAFTFGIGAACVGAAGAMLVLIIDVTPPLGPAYTLLAFVIVITGGLGSMPGALLGGVLIGVTEALAGLLFTPSAKSMFAFAILVLVLLFRPQGILGRKAS